MNRGLTLLLVVAAALLPRPAAAQAMMIPYLSNAYLDTDDDPSTGGTVEVVQAGDVAPQARSGIDVIVRATVQLPPAADWAAASPFVDNVTVLRWNQGSTMFEEVSSYDVTYPVGKGTGLGGHNVIEFTAPLPDIGTLAPTIRMLYHDSVLALNDYTATFAYQPQTGAAIPTVGTTGVMVLGLLLAATGLLLLRRSRTVGVSAAVMGCVMALSGLAWALTITPDGQVADWGGTPPAVTDPIGDSSAGDANEDIVYGFVTNDATTMGFRVDILNVDVSDPYASPTVSPTQPIPTPTSPTPTLTPPVPTPTMPPI